MNIHNFSSDLPSHHTPEKKQNDFHKDLEFIKDTIIENHPGVYNKLDPHFSSQVYKSFRVAQETLNQAHSEKESIQALKTFGKSFNDAHLWVQYDSAKDSIGYLTTEQVEAKPEAPTFSIQCSEGGTWITLPTFAPSKNQIVLLEKIISSLTQHRENTIIFDLRGNGGGNSAFGVDLLKALFGVEYAEHSLAQQEQNVYIKWRASSENLEHVKSFLIPMVKQQFSEDHSVVKQIEATYKGMLNAFADGDHYYIEPKPPETSTDQNISSLFKGEVIAIIDRGCGSACLDFLDGLKAMLSKVTFVGESTEADSVYMELRTVKLPSLKGTFGFPIKVYLNRPRGHNIPYLPDVKYNKDLTL